MKSVIKLNIEEDDIRTMAEQNQKQKEIFKISVVIPNYNYAKFLYQRLYSILYQTTKIHEIIILDDMSSDNSKQVIETLRDLILPYIPVKVIYNTKNSGSAFKQWKKGFEEPYKTAYADRAKPWGTGQAILCCKDIANG